MRFTYNIYHISIWVNSNLSWITRCNLDILNYDVCFAVRVSDGVRGDGARSITSVTVTMQNTGTVTWTRSGSYRLGLAIGDKAIWRINRVELPSDVLPGEQVTFRFNIIAQNIPPDPKHQGNGSGIKRLFQWRMLQEMVEWFGVNTPPVMISID